LFDEYGRGVYLPDLALQYQSPHRSVAKLEVIENVCKQVELRGLLKLGARFVDPTGGRPVNTYLSRVDPDDISLEGFCPDFGRANNSFFALSL